LYTKTDVYSLGQIMYGLFKNKFNEWEKYSIIYKSFYLILISVLIKE
jgi:hypothetical protein